MFRNYLVTAWRNLWKNKTSSIINISGLGIGFAGCVMITMYLFNELKTDSFHKNGDRIYRVTTNYTSKSGDAGTLSTVGRALIGSIRENIPEAEHVVPVRYSGVSIKSNGQLYFDRALYAGENFFGMFSYQFLEGNPQYALSEPYTVVLTKTAAKKYFGNEIAFGKTVLLSDSIACSVTGVIDDPLPSHMAFDALISFPTFLAMGSSMNIWFTWDVSCYVLLKENSDHQSAGKKISALSMKNNKDEYTNNGYTVTHGLEPLGKIYLYSKAGGINVATGKIRQVYILIGVGLLMMLLACMNFINLTTANYIERSREVGIRKSIGAGQSSLIRQFYTEVFTNIILALVLAFALTIFLLPLFNSLINKDLSLQFLLHPGILLSILMITLLTGIIAGWYPSFFMSKLLPLKALHARFHSETKAPALRKILVAGQFCISVILIICAIVVDRQISHMQQQDLGFNKDQVLVIDINKTPSKNFEQSFTGFKHQLAALPFVESITATGAFPGRSGWDGQLVWPEGRTDDKSLTMEVVVTDYNYIRTLGLTMKAGRDFSESHFSDAKYGVLLNEKASALIGWKPEEALGKKIRTAGRDSGIVTGVVADFHQHGLQDKIHPTLFFMYPPACGYLGVRLRNTNFSSNIDKMKTIWSSSFPGYPFDYFFLDEDFNRQYKSESQLQRVFSVFSLLTILIACMGLFGLSAFTVQKRVKEIGIRKVLGASVSGIVALLSKDFLKLIAIGILVASPVAWYIMNSWLQDFAYRISVTWWMFLAAGALVLLTALCTVSFQAIKAAIANPVKSLRTE